MSGTTPTSRAGHWWLAATVIVLGGALLPGDARANTGTPDAGFAGDGSAVVADDDVSFEAVDVFAQGDAMVVHGTLDGTDRLARFTDAGVLDYGFGMNGLTWIYLGSGQQDVSVVPLESGGFAAVATVAGAGSGTRAAVTRYSADGAPAAGGLGAEVYLEDGTTAGAAAAVGDAVVFTVDDADGTRLIRFADGAIDPSFAAEVTVSVDRLVADDTSIIAVGEGDNGPFQQIDIFAQRFSAAGAWDGAYGDEGTATLDYAGAADDHLRDVLIDGAGGVVVVWALVLDPEADHPHHSGMMRLTAAGNKDWDFGNGTGAAMLPPEVRDDHEPHAVTRGADGTLYLVGGEGEETRAWAYTAAGDFAPTFGCASSAVIDADPLSLERPVAAAVAGSKLIAFGDAYLGELPEGQGPHHAWYVAAFSLEQAAAGCGWVVTATGELHAVSAGAVEQPLVPATTRWGWDIARGVAAHPGHRGGYVVDGWGGFHPFGYSGEPAPGRPTGTPYWHGWDIVRGAAAMPDGTGGYVLDGWGGLHRFAADGSAPPRADGPYWYGWDIARDVAILPDGTGGYVVDGWGGLHPFGIGGNAAPPAATGGPYWVDWDIADGIVLLGDGSGGYVIDGWGGAHPFRIGDHPTPPPLNGPYWYGNDTVRGATFIP